MSERAALLASVAGTVKDYRAGELAQPTAAHVDQWIQQFDGSVQLPMLRELDEVLKKMYFSRTRVFAFLKQLVRNGDLAGSDPCDFWRRARFLRIQQQGYSQEELLALFDMALEEECALKTEECGEDGGEFVYLDDAMFSGNRVGNDLEAWVKQDAPPKAVVHVVVMALHSSGKWLVGNRIKNTIASSGKRIEVKYWRAMCIENRKYCKKDAEVLWPAELPDDKQLTEYLAQPHKYPFEARPVGGQLGPFSSEAGRELLEREFTLAGVRIRGFCQTPKDILRPLGFSPFGLGFGSLIVTFRNCPNNCPLALWWGDPEAPSSHPFSHWYPLFPRKTYEPEVDQDDFDF